MTDRAKIVAERRKRLAAWIQEHHQGKQSAFNTAAGMNQGLTSSLLKDKSFGEEMAANIEAKAKMPAGYLVRPFDAAGAAPNQLTTLTARLQAAEDELDAFKTITNIVLEALSATIPAEGAEAMLAAMRKLPAGVSVAQQDVLATATAALARGQKAKAPAGRPVARGGSPSKR